jgi:hypothetical protein
MLVKDWPDKELLGERLCAIVSAQEELWDRMRILERYLRADLELCDWVAYVSIDAPGQFELVEAFMRDFGETNVGAENV